MRNEMMSSEESGPDDTIVVRTLRWRSHRVNHTFHKIDNFILSSQSPSHPAAEKQEIILYCFKAGATS